jgi:hypothetical protein
MAQLAVPKLKAKHLKHNFSNKTPPRLWGRFVCSFAALAAHFAFAVFATIGTIGTAFLAGAALGAVFGFGGGSRDCTRDARGQNSEKRELSDELFHFQSSLVKALFFRVRSRVDHDQMNDNQDVRAVAGRGH